MKNKGLSLLLLLLGGAAVYYYYKNSKKKYKGSVIVDPLDKGEFPDDSGKFPSDYEEFPLVPKRATTEQLSKQLRSANSVNISILDQIKEMQKPNPVITYQKFYKPDIDAVEPEQSYQSFYATINGKRVGVPYSI